MANNFSKHFSIQGRESGFVVSGDTWLAGSGSGIFDVWGLFFLTTYFGSLHGGESFGFIIVLYCLSRSLFLSKKFLDEYKHTILWATELLEKTYDFLNISKFGQISWIWIQYRKLYVQEFLTQFMQYLTYEKGQDFFDIQYISSMLEGNWYILYPLSINNCDFTPPRVKPRYLVQYTKRFIYYRKSVLHLLQRMFHDHSNRCSADLR